MSDPMQSDGGVRFPNSGIQEELIPVPFSTPDEGNDHILTAKKLVQETTEFFNAANNMVEPLPLDQIYVVMFSYILGNWKALVSTTQADGRYYEVTHNSTKNETYVDTYVKTSNTKHEGK